MKQHWRSNSSFINFCSPHSPTFMGPLIASLLCALPRSRLWQNFHFRHICQIRCIRQLLWAPFTALCFASLAIVAKLSFSPYLPNLATFSIFAIFVVVCISGHISILVKISDPARRINAKEIGNKSRAKQQISHRKERHRKTLYS